MQCNVMQCLHACMQDNAMRCNACMHVCMHPSMYAFTQCLHAMHACMYACVRVRVHVKTCMYINLEAGNSFEVGF